MHYLNIFMIVVGILGGIFLLLGSARRSALSGFRFYFTTALIKVIPVFVIFLLYMYPTSPRSPWLLLLVFGLSIGSVMEHWQKGRIRKERPAEWEAWIRRAAQARQSSPLDKLLLGCIGKIDQ